MQFLSGRPDLQSHTDYLAAICTTKTQFMELLYVSHWQSAQTYFISLQLIYGF